MRNPLVLAVLLPVMALVLAAILGKLATWRKWGWQTQLRTWFAKLITTLVADEHARNRYYRAAVGTYLLLWIVLFLTWDPAGGFSSFLFRLIAVSVLALGIEVLVPFLGLIVVLFLLDAPADLFPGSG